MRTPIQLGVVAAFLVPVLSVGLCACHSRTRSHPPEDDVGVPPAAEGAFGRRIAAAELAERKKQLPRFVYHVTQEEGTEPPFHNAYWNNHSPGIYVDVVSGEPLFSSQQKYESGTGWPSFWQPLEKANIKTRDDSTLGMSRVEVHSRIAGSHLGHVFEDGPPPTGLRYCMDSASLRFVAAENLTAEGYATYASLFPEIKQVPVAEKQAPAAEKPVAAPEKPLVPPPT